MAGWLDWMHGFNGTRGGGVAGRQAERFCSVTVARAGICCYYWKRHEMAGPTDRVAWPVFSCPEKGEKYTVARFGFIW
jgi:hypothetical protein